MFEFSQESLITEGIRISVLTKFLPEQSNSYGSSYVFAYRIEIFNETGSPVKLISRHWDIIDGVGEVRVVEGEGVVGKQPVIKPFESYAYTSGCIFKTPFGKMSGYYVMIDPISGDEFKALIPTFILQAPFANN